MDGELGQGGREGEGKEVEGRGGERKGREEGK